MKTIYILLIGILVFSCNDAKNETEKVSDSKKDSTQSTELKNPALNKMRNDLNEDETNLSSLEDGFHELKYPNGNMKSTGTISNGKKEGLWVFYREDGKKWSECEYLNGKAHGKVISYHPNEAVYYIGYFNQGVKTGIWMFYDEKSNLIKEENVNKK